MDSYLICALLFVGMFKIGIDFLPLVRPKLGIVARQQKLAK